MKHSNYQQQQTAHSLFSHVWEIMKKILKYTIYAAILYFAYKGFMNWE